MLNNSMVDRIRTLAAEKGTSLKKIEADTGLGNGTIRRWDDTSPSVDKLLKVANLLNVSLDYLVKGKGTASPEDQEWLDLIHSLPKEARRDFLGAIRIHVEMHQYMEKEEARLAAGN